MKIKFYLLLVGLAMEVLLLLDLGARSQAWRENHLCVIVPCRQAGRCETEAVLGPGVITDCVHLKLAECVSLPDPYPILPRSVLHIRENWSCKSTVTTNICLVRVNIVAKNFRWRELSATVLITSTVPHLKERSCLENASNKAQPQKMACVNLRVDGNMQIQHVITAPGL